MVNGAFLLCVSCWCFEYYTSLIEPYLRNSKCHIYDAALAGNWVYIILADLIKSSEGASSAVGARWSLRSERNAWRQKLR